jgi:hypothetical protein
MKRALRATVAVLLIAGLFPSATLAATGPEFTVEPGGGAVGAVWSQQPRVAIKTGNNTVESASGSIALTIAPGTGAPGAVLTCTATSVALSNGIATFSGCRIDKAGTGYRLVATWSDGGTDQSAAFTITGPAGAGTKLGFSTQPARGTLVGPLAVQPSVAVQNASGATVTNVAPTVVTLAMGANPGGAVLTCTGGLTKTTANGVATFSGCRLDKVGVGYTLTATATALTSATSALFDVADRLAFTTQPAGAVAGVALATQPVIAVRAGANATATHDGATSVTLAIGANPGGGVLTCTGGLSKVAVAGVATFAGCSISKGGVGYTLVASSSGLTAATSTPFNVAAAANLTLTNSASVITWGNTLSLTARIDQSGANRQIQLQGSKNGSTWTPIVTVVTDASGNATFLYRPATNLFYRAVFAGSPDLTVLTSGTTRTVVRQISILRPTNSGSVRRVPVGTTIGFVDTVRPARPELAAATVRFVFYRLVSGVWTQIAQRDVVINSAGLASTSWTFPATGEWYVRSQARPTPNNANSVWGPVERYSVR